MVVAKPGWPKPSTTADPTHSVTTWPDGLASCAAVPEPPTSSMPSSSQPPGVAAMTSTPVTSTTWNTSPITSPARSPSCPSVTEVSSTVGRPAVASALPASEVSRESLSPTSWQMPTLAYRWAESPGGPLVGTMSPGLRAPVHPRMGDATGHGHRASMPRSSPHAGLCRGGAEAARSSGPTARRHDAGRHYLPQQAERQVISWARYSRVLRVARSEATCVHAGQHSVPARNARNSWVVGSSPSRPTPCLRDPGASSAASVLLAGKDDARSAGSVRTVAAPAGTPRCSARLRDALLQLSLPRAACVHAVRVITSAARPLLSVGPASLRGTEGRARVQVCPAAGDRTPA